MRVLKRWRFFMISTTLPLDDEARPARGALAWLLLCVIWSVLPLLSYLPMWIALLFACALAWCYLAAHHGWPLPNRALHLAMALVAIIAVYKHYGMLLGRNAGIGLLVVLIGFKLLELRTLRDYMLAVFLQYILILGGFLYSQSIWLAVHMLIAVIFTTAALFRLTQPTGIYIFDRLRLAGRLLLQALPLMLAIYFLFPRIQGGLWGLPQDARAGATGIGEIMQPGSVLSLTESTETAFRVEFKQDAPSPEQLYWRVLVLWHTDGQTWTRAQGPEAPGLVAAFSYRALGPPVTYDVFLEPSSQRRLPALDLPASIPEMARVLPGYLLEYGTPIRERLHYSLTSYPSYNTGALSPFERGQALQLPENTGVRIRELAASWRQIRADAGVVRAALRFFRQENFVYTLHPPPLAENAVEDFLFTTRRGFCEHFASAFVTLMRAAGIPSRVVLGYLGGEYNPAGDYFIVRQADAHAWAEVWLAGQGWVRVDPTAAVAPERVEFGLEAVRRLERRGAVPGRLAAQAVLDAIKLGWVDGGWRKAQLFWDAFNNSWNHWVSGYGREQQQQFLGWLGFKAPSWVEMVATLALTVTLIIFGLAAVTLYSQPPFDPAQAAYLSFCRKLAASGLIRMPSEGALSFARRCRQTRPELSPAIDAIVSVYIRLRYGDLVEVEEVQRLQRLVKRFRP